MNNHFLDGQAGIFGKIVIHSNIFNGFLIPLKKSIFQKYQYFGVVTNSKTTFRSLHD